MLLGRMGNTLVLCHLQRLNQFIASLLRQDNLVDVSQLGCPVGIGKFLGVFAHRFGFRLASVTRYQHPCEVLYLSPESPLFAQAAAAAGANLFILTSG